MADEALVWRVFLNICCSELIRACWAWGWLSTSLGTWTNSLNIKQHTFQQAHTWLYNQPFPSGQSRQMFSNTLEGQNRPVSSPSYTPTHSFGRVRTECGLGIRCTCGCKVGTFCGVESGMGRIRKLARWWLACFTPGRRWLCTSGRVLMGNLALCAHGWLWGRRIARSLCSRSCPGCTGSRSRANIAESHNLRMGCTAHHSRHCLADSLHTRTRHGLDSSCYSSCNNLRRDLARHMHLEQAEFG